MTLKPIRRFLVALVCRIAGYDVCSVTKAGYEQACTGSDLNGATHVGAYNYSVKLAIQKSERNRLSTALREFAAGHDLQFFDFRQGSSSFPSRRMAAFSPRGLHIHADMITGNSSATRKMLTSSVILVASTFANHDEWPPVLRALDTVLRTQWPDKTGPESLARVEAINVPSFEKWLELSDAERVPYLRQFWRGDDGKLLVDKAADRFRLEYAHLPGLTVDGARSPHGGGWEIDVTHDVIFDRRWIPGHYLGFNVHSRVQPPLPPEFADQHYPDGYAWSPPNFERFVDRCATEIRQRLGNPTMSRAEMLHALIGTPFEEFVAHCRESVKKGFIPPFE